jgi:hypothetical protein
LVSSASALGDIRLALLRGLSTFGHTFSVSLLQPTLPSDIRNSSIVGAL